MLRLYGCITEQHDLALVLLAALICVLSSYTMFSLFARARGPDRASRIGWLAAAAVVTGCGVWATHFVAMLAFLPGLPVGYGIGLTALSVLISIALSAIGLLVVQRSSHAILGGIIIGAAISAMHYVGMMALHVPAVEHWDAGLVVVSLAIGSGLGALALWLAECVPGLRGRLFATTALTLAICGMHFTAMAALRLESDPRLALPDHVIAQQWLAVGIAGTALLILALALLGSIVDQHMAQRTARDAEKLRAAHQQQRAIFEASPHGICVVSRLGTERQFTACNRAFEALYGYAPGALLGQSIRICFRNDEEFESFGRQRREAIADNHTFVSEVLQRRRDGEDLWIRIVGRALDENDPDAGGVYITEDVTERHHADEAIRQAKQLAEDATRLKSDFLANMSHEIRTPMNAIIGLAHLALKTELTQRQQDYLQKIQRSGQHLMGIINDILDFSKIEAGKLTVELTPFKLEDVLDNVASLTAEKATAKGLELIFDIDKNVPLDLIGDPLRLGQILINYTNNAVKFTDNGEIAVTVTIDQETPDDVLVRFSVRDTGIGLTEAQIGRLFQSFEQADTSTTRRFGGTGLGLAISKRLAELMDGEVGVASELGKGSRFWFTARLAKAAPRARLTVTPDLRARRVLVVDDNANARTVLCEMLSSLTFRVSEAGSGAAAIEMISQAVGVGDPFEAVFLDWQMPGMHGIDVARRVTGMGLEPAPHLAMVTAYGRDEILAGAREAGIEHVLIKPVNPSILFDTVMLMLGSSPEPRNAAQPARIADLPDELAAIAGARLLLVEDNDLNQEVAIGLLSEAGFSVDTASDGAAACRMIHETDYDLVLMDMHMPVMDGVEATREIRKDTRFVGLPIVAMTANAMKRDRDRCIEAGMNDYVTKPIDPDALWAALRKWIAPRSKAASPSPQREIRDTNEPIIPHHLDGVDVALGLRRVAGNKALYLNLLSKFAIGQKDVPAQVAAAIGAGDIETAERMAHTLKGLAGTIGAMKLSGQAALLERTIEARRPSSEIVEILAQLDAILVPIITQLATTLTASTKTEVVRPGNGVDRGHIAKILACLAVALAEEDSEAVDLWEAHSADLREALGKQHEIIQTAIADFDFEAALSALRWATGASQLAH